ncbi:MAG: molybdopterin molybdotransferase MoeA [Planctomycetia bacterium]|nr:molybdopterin molybdotransferase MoeA [Planctomycetia bacterium]
MIEPDDALKVILENTPVLESTRLPLADALGGVLAEPVASDMDLPPFDKSAMDGFAARSADLERLPAELEVVEEIPAGAWPQKSVGAGQCAKIMTGAPVPQGADCVVMVEKTEPAGPGRVRVTEAERKPNICRLGEDIASGEVVLEAGHRIRPEEVGLLASVGCVNVTVVRRPEVAVLATGDEIVPPEQKPGPGEIRGANACSGGAQIRRAGFAVRDLGIAKDERGELADRIREGLRSDVLLVSGGVSVGEYDFVPAVFKELGVEIKFEKVAIKPGKPTVFGTHSGGLIFGLPGNPVSSLVVCRLFVLPALMKMAGDARPPHRFVDAVLAEPVKNRKGRQAYMPAVLTTEDGVVQARLPKYHGSADLVALAKANALLIVPADTERIEAGETVRALWIDD